MFNQISTPGMEEKTCFCFAAPALLQLGQPESQISTPEEETQLTHATAICTARMRGTKSNSASLIPLIYMYTYTFKEFRAEVIHPWTFMELIEAGRPAASTRCPH